MAEYIERESVMKAFADYVWNSNHSDLVPAPQWNHAVEIVRDTPAADVVKVRHGKWILKDKSALDRKPKRGEEIFCDQCGEIALGYPFWECDLKPSNFCPNCGAKMDGGADND